MRTNQRWNHWHRRLGLLAALPLLVVAVTGVLIQFSVSLNWDERPMRGAWLGWLYNLEPRIPDKGFRINVDWMSRQGGQLLLNTKRIASCPERLVGAVRHREVIVAVCGRRLLFLRPDGTLVESRPGLPANTQALGSDEKGLAISTAQGPRVMDPVLGQWQPGPETSAIDWARARTLPEALREQLAESAPLPGIHLERVLLDLHSGRLFGPAGVWIVNLLGLAVTFLALTGALTWYRRLARTRADRGD